MPSSRYLKNRSHFSHRTEQGVWFLHRPHRESGKGSSPRSWSASVAVPIAGTIPGTTNTPTTRALVQTRIAEETRAEPAVLGATIVTAEHFLSVLQAVDTKAVLLLIHRTYPPLSTTTICIHKEVNR